MKIHVDLPGGGAFEFERQPMSSERFEYVCLLTMGAGALSLLMTIVLALR